MNLIDILVEELPKRGGWPEGVIKISSTSCGRVFFDGQSPHGFTLPVASDAWDSHKHPFSYTNAVTREQYEAALAAKNEGWIEWSGGECPVADFLKVEYQLRGGAKWSDSAKILEWQHEGGRHDIIAYRLHKPQEAVHGEAGDKANLNECASNDAEHVWNGEGLPPVGCECEVDYGSVELIDGLSRPDDGDVVRVVSHEKTGFGTQVVVVYWNGVNGGGRAHALIPKCLRPLHTDAERKREAAVEIMTQILCSPSQVSATAKKIYDAIAAGKIPGVKLED